MAEVSISTGEKTSSALIRTGACALCSVLVITDGTNAATVIVYDNTAASGKVVAEFVVAGATGYGGRNWIFPVAMDNGIYLAISGTGASAVVEYLDRGYR